MEQQGQSNTLSLNPSPSQACLSSLTCFSPSSRVLLSRAVDVEQTLAGPRYSSITQHHLLLPTLITSCSKFPQTSVDLCSQELLTLLSSLLLSHLSHGVSITQYPAGAQPDHGHSDAQNICLSFQMAQMLPLRCPLVLTTDASGTACRKSQGRGCPAGVVGFLAPA